MKLETRQLVENNIQETRKLITEEFQEVRNKTNVSKMPRPYRKRTDTSTNGKQVKLGSSAVFIYIGR